MSIREEKSHDSERWEEKEGTNFKLTVGGSNGEGGATKFGLWFQLV
jgi:hypothetical protein